MIPFPKRPINLSLRDHAIEPRENALRPAPPTPNAAVSIENYEPPLPSPNANAMGREGRGSSQLDQQSRSSCIHEAASGCFRACKAAYRSACSSHCDKKLRQSLKVRCKQECRDEFPLVARSKDASSLVRVSVEDTSEEALASGDNGHWILRFKDKS